MMPNPKYFSTFPKKQQNFFGVKHTITDLNRYIRVSPDVIASRYAFYDYVIKDGERPDHVAYYQYGDSKYYWIILLVNNIRDLWREWPMTNSEFESYLTFQYGSVSNAQSCTYRYVTTEGVVIDEQTALSLPNTEYTAQSCYEYENEINESKRDIRLIQKRYLSQFQTEMTQLFEDSE